MRTARHARGSFVVKPRNAFVINAATGLATLILGLPWQQGEEVLTPVDKGSGHM